MERASTGGRDNWAGAAFELRLGVEFCVDILVGVDAGLAPGAARRVQLQAPEPVDDLVLEFETGARWAIQAKAGPSVRVEWGPDRPFGKALRQLYHGATCGQIDLAPDSLDQVVLAVDHRAPGSVTDFGHWVARARHHHTWERFAAACTNQAEREWVRQLPALVAAEPGDELLAFLRKLYVRRRPAADEWRSDLRGRLRAFGVPDNGTADRVLDVLLARVAEVAPDAGQLDYDDLRRACAGIPGVPRPGPPSFRLFRHPSEDELYRALHMPSVRLGHFVERSELTEALGSGQGVLVAGRPGSGKSHALIKLALARPEWPVVVVAGHFREDDLGRLVAQLRRVHGPVQFLWDNVHDKPGLFADAVLRLRERADDVRVLAAYREQYEATVRERVTPDLCRRAGLPPEPLRLQPFDESQAAQMAQAVVEALALELDADARDAFARHIRRGDGGPLFALSIGLLLQGKERQGERVRVADVTDLPDDLLDVWHHLYQRLADRHEGFAMQSLLGVLHFLHRINCPLHVRLVGLLFTRVLGYSRGDMRGAARTLAREGWMRREGEEFAAHDVTLEAVPEEEDSFSDFVQFAHGGVEGEKLALGLLRGSLSIHYQGQLPHTRTAWERRAAAAEAMELGELAVADFRAIERTVHLATALNNTSGCYSALAGLEETREGRVRMLKQAVAAIEEAATIRRDLGLRADLAMSLNNASGCYSDLAGQEETREGRVRRLEQAVAAIEEAARLYRDLGLRADLAMSLNNAAKTYFGMMGVEEDEELQVSWLRKALQAIQVAVDIFRVQGIIPYLMVGLRNVVISHLQLAEHTGELDRARVLALCREGEALCGPMEDQEGLAFFRRVRQQLQG
jgi:hypothetical protein